jgi:hypothetical protein
MLSAALVLSCSERAGWWGPTGGAESKLSPWYGPDRNRVSDSHSSCCCTAQKPEQHDWLQSKVSGVSSMSARLPMLCGEHMHPEPVCVGSSTMLHTVCIHMSLLLLHMS